MNITKETYTIGAILLAIICFSLGISIGKNILGNSDCKNLIDVLAMLGNWVSGVGALSAVIAAIYIAHGQATTARRDGCTKCTHHAIAVVNDLRGRTHYFHSTLKKGQKPLSSLTKNAEAIGRRYEALYDRDIYQYMPGPIIDMITGLSPSFLGIEMLTASIASSLNNKDHQMLESGPLINFEQSTALEALQVELDKLLSCLERQATSLHGI